MDQDLTFRPSRLQPPGEKSLEPSGGRALRQGQAYWVRVFTAQRAACLLSDRGEAQCLTPWGQVVAEEWQQVARSRAAVGLDDWHIRADGIAGVVWLPPGELALGRGESKPRLLSTFVASFKAAAAKRINLQRNQPGLPVWETSYQGQPLTTVSELALARQRLRQSQLPT